MVQIDLEILPMAIGFFLFFALQRLLSIQPRGRSAKDADPDFPCPGAEALLVADCGKPAAQTALGLAAPVPLLLRRRALLQSLVAAALLLALGAGILLTPLAKQAGMDRSHLVAEPSDATAASQVLEAAPSAPADGLQSAGARNGSLAVAGSAPHVGVAAAAAAPLPGVTAPGDLAAATTAPGSITLKLRRQHMPVQVVGDVVYHKSAYVGTVYMGSPPVPFTVVFDTGSGHLILPSTYCHSDVCRARRRYKRSSSKSAKDINCDGTVVQPRELRDQITISFGTGEISGVFVEDKLCLAEPPAGAQRGSRRKGAKDVAQPGCMTMRMIAATAMSEDPFADFDFDGVLGLGLPGLSQAAPFNFLGVVAGHVGQGARDLAHTFAVFLAEEGAQEEEESEITFGGYDRERLDGDLAWSLVDEPQLGQWMVKLRSLRVGGEPLAYCAEGCRAILDTGTSLLTVPTPAFTELFDLLKHPSANGRDCRGAGPQLHFELEGATLTLEPQDYAHFDSMDAGRGPAAATSASTRDLTAGNLTVGAEGAGPPAEEQEAEQCNPMLMTMDLPAPIGPKLFILGEPILRKYYTVYDSSAPPRIGFGRLRKGGRGPP